MKRGPSSWVLVLLGLGAIAIFQLFTSQSKKRLPQEVGLQHLLLSVFPDNTQQADRDACYDRTFNIEINKRIQEDFCLRNFDESLNATGLEVVKMHGYSNQSLPIYVYTSHSIISDYLRDTGEWERYMMLNLVNAMKRAQEWYGLSSPSDLYFLDIGGNLGSVTLFVSSEGFSTIVFEPMLQNEQALRSTLCLNKITDRVTYFPRGVGMNTTVSTRVERVFKNVHF